MNQTQYITHRHIGEKVVTVSISHLWVDEFFVVIITR